MKMILSDTKCHYLDGVGGFVMGAEGVITRLPGRSSDRRWSEVPKNDIRNVEAEGSNPFISTKSPGQRAKVGSPQLQKVPVSAA